MNGGCCTSSFTSAGGTSTSASSAHRSLVQLSFQTISKPGVISEYSNPTVFTVYETFKASRELLKSPKRIMWISKEK